MSAFDLCLSHAASVMTNSCRARHVRIVQFCYFIVVAESRHEVEQLKDRRLELVLVLMCSLSLSFVILNF